MELSCPSCSRTHKTEDHPGAFEIQCACGYSILVPDEAQFALHPLTGVEGDLVDEAPLHNFEQAPAALVESEQDNSIALPPVSEMQEPKAAFDTPVSEQEMTNIGGLPYDPYLINQNSEESQVVTSVEKADEADHLNQSLAGRVFLAHLAQPENATFHLKLKQVDAEAVERLKKKLESFLKSRPWLANRLLELGVSLEQIQVGEVEWQKVPESFAVEVYLSAFEVGARCEVLE